MTTKTILFTDGQIGVDVVDGALKVTGITFTGDMTIADVTIDDGDDTAQGTTTDAAASSTVAENATARTSIGLWKGIKNVLILAVAGINSLIALLPATLAAHGGLKVEGVASGVAVPVSVALLPAALAAGGGLKVEGVAGGVAQPISGNVGRAATAVTPDNQASTNAYADVDGSILDTLNNLAVSYTIVNVLNDTIQWKVLGANASDFSDAIVAQAEADLALNAIGSYSASVAVWRYYKIQIKSKVAETPGTVQVRGVTKG